MLVGALLPTLERAVAGAGARSQREAIVAALALVGELWHLLSELSYPWGDVEAASAPPCCQCMPQSLKRPKPSPRRACSLWAGARHLARAWRGTTLCVHLPLLSMSQHQSPLVFISKQAPAPLLGSGSQPAAGGGSFELSPLSALPPLEWVPLLGPVKLL